MRVTHVITRLIVGGAQENTVASVLGLRDKPEVEIKLISGPTTGPEGSIEPTAAVTGLLSVVPHLVRPIHPLKDWLALRRLTRTFREQPPDIVHTHSGKAGILGRLAAYRARVPVIVHTIHGPSFGAFQGIAANAAFRAAERFAGRFTTHFVVVANAMTEQYLAAGIGRPDQYTRIFSGFSLEPYLSARNDPALRKRLGINATDFVVGKIARLFKLKGHDDLFAVAPELLRKCHRLKILLIGDGEWRGRFEQMAKSHGVEDHFIFAGLVPPPEVARYVGIMDALAHLSSREGLPRALPQALAAGKPVVAYDCDGASEVCLDGETGFLLKPRDLEGLTEKLLVLAGNPDLCRRLGQRGQELVKQSFSVERMIDDLYSLYRMLLNQHAVPRRQ
ncbi:MAG TPA: glycosyltransferase [Verrucomicrobiae bacterium]|nr:glycosyltransferase [Verrucomicrobiae bacterium]